MNIKRTNLHDLPEGRVLSSLSKEVTIGLLDGKYTNQMDLLHIDEIIDFDQSVGATFRNISSTFYHIRDFQVTHKKACKLDMVFENRESGEHKVNMTNADPSQPCFALGTEVRVETSDVSSSIRQELLMKLIAFSLIASVLQGFMVKYLKQQDHLFYHSLVNRLYGDGNADTYANKFSFLTFLLIFFSHFGLAVIYCQVIETSYTTIFLVPAILQLINLFYISKMFGFLLRLKSIEYYNDFNRQQTWITWTQFKICKSVLQLTSSSDLFAIFYLVWINLIYFNKNFIFICLGSLWVPQIWFNTTEGVKKALNMDYVVFQTIHLLFLPLYFQFYDGNFFFFKPSRSYVMLLGVWQFV